MGRLKTMPSRLGKPPQSRLAQAGGVGGYEREATGSAWRTIRRRILTRDCSMCLPCRAGERFTLAEEVDHITPVFEGGTDDDGNLQSICRPCHKVKNAGEAARRAAT
jgi:5-methylcytosine-specific restriction protein A